MNDYAQAATFNDPLAGRYAGFWIKLAAPIIDLIFSMPFYYALMAVVPARYHSQADLLFTVVIILAYALFFGCKWHATPGMRIMNFHAVDREGGAPSYGRCFAWVGIYAIGVCLCFSGVIYMQSRFDLNAVLQLQMSCISQNFEMKECNDEIENLIGIPVETFRMMTVSSAGLAAFLIVIWSLSVALTKDKSGFHNLASGMRFIKGRV